MAFRLCDFDAVGFDVDHAFVQYKLENLFPVSCIICMVHFCELLLLCSINNIVQY